MTTVKLNGQDYVLKFDYNALCSFEQATDKSFLKFFNDLDEQGFLSMQLSDLRALLWAGLLHNDGKFKLTDAGNLLNLDDMECIETVSAALTNAISEAFPKGVKAALGKKKVNEAQK
jgi:hypothetical protein